jgi:eukaryotic-like serine/threonine-protein kinase
VTAVQLGDRYQLDHRIASGGMGAVWRAVDRLLDRPVAVKLLRRELADDPAFVERFRREARAAAALTHPNVAGVFDYGERDGQAFIVMELVEGENLAERLARTGPLPWPEALAVAEQVARALAAAHAHGLVHRDVKPANVLLGNGIGDGSPHGTRSLPDPLVVKVTDFGIAQAAQAATTLTGTGTILGSASYVAPEQASGEQVGPAADLYSLGCVLFEMVTGRAPYQGDNAVALATQHISGPVPNPRAIRPDLPGTVAAIVLKAMQKDPGQRFASATAMADALAGARPTAPAAARSGETTAVLPVVGAGPPPRWASVDGRPPAAVPGAAAPSGPTERAQPLPASLRQTRPVGPPPRIRYRRTGGAGRWARAVGALAVVALVLLAWFTFRDAREVGPPRTGGAATATAAGSRVRLPDVRGLSDEQARAALAKLGFKVSAPKRHGVVIGTRPRPGSLARRGSTVQLLLAPFGKGEKRGGGQDGDGERGGNQQGGKDN